MNAAFAVSPALHAAGPTLFHSLLRGGESNYCCQPHSCATVRLRLRLCLRLYAAEHSSFACSSSSGATSLLGSTCVSQWSYLCACFYSSRCRDRVLLVSRPSPLALPASSSGASSHSSPEEVRTRLRLRPSAKHSTSGFECVHAPRPPRLARENSETSRLCLCSDTAEPPTRPRLHASESSRGSACRSSSRATPTTAVSPAPAVRPPVSPAKAAGPTDSACVLNAAEPSSSTLPASTRSGATVYRLCRISCSGADSNSCSARAQRVRPQGLVLVSTGTSSSPTHSQSADEAQLLSPASSLCGRLHHLGFACFARQADASPS